MLDFFNSDCIEPKRNDIEFGICDDQDGEKAYTDNTNSDKWIAIVKNHNKKEIVFTAIDNCLLLLKKGTLDEESTCDGMLTFENSLFLVELKIQKKGGLPKAISQLENTISLVNKYNDISKIRYKKAYICNKKPPKFQVIENEKTGDFLIQQDLE